MCNLYHDNYFSGSWFVAVQSNTVLKLISAQLVEKFTPACRSRYSSPYTQILSAHNLYIQFHALDQYRYYSDIYFRKLYVVHIRCIRHIFVICNCSCWHAIYIFDYFSTHSLTFLNLNMPSPGGLNYTGKTKRILGQMHIVVDITLTYIHLIVNYLTAFWVYDNILLVFRL